MGPSDPTLDLPSNLPLFFSLLWKHSISREQTLVRERGAGSLRAIPRLDLPFSLLSESPLAFKRSFNLPPYARQSIDALENEDFYLTPYGPSIKGNRFHKHLLESSEERK